MISLLAAVLLLQNPMPEGELFDNARDLDFDRVQTQWVAEAAGVHDLDRVLDERHALLIRCLGSKTYDARKLATLILTEEKERAIPALMWGTLSKDAEIARKCEVLLYRFYICVACDGAGEIRIAREPWDRDPDGAAYRMVTCRECMGYPDPRFFADWQTEKMLPRNLWGDSWRP
jgi:hypothetical protein